MAWPEPAQVRVGVAPEVSVQLARLALLLAAVPGGGCALLAQKTPTPAAHLDDTVVAFRPQPGVRHFLVVYGSQRPTGLPASPLSYQFRPMRAFSITA